MDLINDIFEWTQVALPLWQRDATRRLFQQPDGLSEADYGELYTLLKDCHGIPDPQKLKPTPLDATHLPVGPQVGKSVVLKKLRDLKHVNRIASNQTLNIASTGMTVIYGGNGTGKSGYARVMKRACRARDQAETVHSDANDPTNQGHLPEATFDIEINGISTSVNWTANTVPPEELSTIAVFDCHCARAYLTAEQDVAYLPYGLDVVENLANKVLPELSRRLELEISTINIDRRPFDHMLGDTRVGQMISGLGAKTDPKKLKALGILSEQEIKRIDELDHALAEADPQLKAKELRLSAGRLKALAGKVESSHSWVRDCAVNTLKDMDNALVVVNQAERLAAENLRAGEKLLPGTGEQGWKRLFDAARKFSTEVAYPGIEFPYTGEGAVCPLCQEPIKAAGERLNRFEEYIRNDVAKAAAQQRDQIEAEKKRMEQAILDVGLDKSLTEELAMLDETVASETLAFQAALKARRTWMLEALVSHVWDSVPSLSENPRPKLRSLAAYQFRSARTFDRAADEAKRKAIKAERDELHARQNLASCVDGLLALLDRMKLKQLLEACKKDLRTKPISDKSKDLASNAVTTTLKKALDDEFKALGMSHIKTKLKDRNDKGKVKHQLLLDLPANNKLELILSEGEQRAIALGSFLAELRLANHGDGIVFDDPVSSLDHKRRGKVAKRLASESLKRQVLVFTHDVVFLHQLRDESNKLNASISFYFLEASGGYYGNVSEGLPWAHKSYKERIDSLEKAQKKFEKLPWPADPSEELAGQIIQQYSFLRATVERVVQDFVLNSTVQRFRDYIEIKNLGRVVGLKQSEVDEVSRIYQRCHELVEAHDPSSAKNDPPPTPDELEQDIADLKSLIQSITDRRKGAGL